MQAAALETAEGLAERIHQQMRDRWGFPDPADFTMAERFAAKYQGVRVSFGYPACPNLEDQAKLFQLLKPEKIGIELTDGFMMEPEASVTALVFLIPKVVTLMFCLHNRKTRKAHMCFSCFFRYKNRKLTNTNSSDQFTHKGIRRIRKNV